MNFGDYFRGKGKLPLPKCIYCSSEAEVGCHGCGAPMCKKHGQVEEWVPSNEGAEPVKVYKCRLHVARTAAPEGATV